MDGEKTIEALKNLESGSAISMHQDMKNLAAYLTWFSPCFIRSPFKARYMKLLKDKSTLLLADSNGNLATLNRTQNEILNHVTVPSAKISSLLVSSSKDDILLGTENGQIKILTSKLELVDTISISKSAILEIQELSPNVHLIGTKSGELMEISLTDGVNLTEIDNLGRPIKSISISNNKTLVGTENGTINIYLDLKEMKKNIFNLQHEISSVAWANENIAVVYKSDVWIISEKDGSELMDFKSHEKDVNCIAFFEEYLITGSADNTVKVWNTRHVTDEITLSGHDIEVVDLLVEDGIIHSLDIKGNLRASRIPSFPYSSIIRPQRSIRSLIYSSYLKSTLAIFDNYEITTIPKKKIVFDSYDTRKIISTAFTDYSKVLVLFQVKDLLNCNVLVRFINLENSGVETKVLRTGSLPQACTATEEFKYLITGELYRVTIWKALEGIQYYLFCNYNSIVSIVCKGMNVLAADSGGIIKQYDLNTLEENSTFNEKYEEKIKEIYLNEDKSLIFVVSNEKQLRVYQITQGLSIFDYSFPESINKILFQKDGSHFFISFRKSVQLWSLKSFAKQFSISFPNKIISFELDPQDQKILIVFKDCFKIIDNPLNARVVTVYGQMNNTSVFLDYISKIFKGQKPKFSSKMNRFIIEPFHINVLHIYAYFNMHDYIDQAFKSEIGFFAAKLGYDPLQVAIEKGNKDVQKALINNLIPFLQSSPNLFYYISRSLTNLNYLSAENLSVLYDLSFRQNKDLSIHRFCKDEVKLPVVSLYKDTFLSIHEKVEHANEGEGQAVEYYQSYLNINLDIGSSSSVEFLKSLVESKNLDIFNTFFLKVLIQFKWDKVRWVHYLDCFLYVCYFVAFLTGALSHHYHYLLIVSFVISQVLFIYEVFQVVSSPMTYFKSFVNYSDLLRSLCLDLYCIFEYLDRFEEYQNWLFLFTLFVSIIRAYGYFRVFKPTRWLVYFIIEVFSELWSLLLVAAYAIFALWVVNFDLKSSSLLNFDSEIKLSIMLFFFILILNPLVIIDLFINIVGNALEKTQNEKGVRDLQEVCEMVFEAETLMVWRRQCSGVTSLQMCDVEKEAPANKESLAEKIKKAAENIELIKEFYGKNDYQIKDLKESLELSIKEIEQKVDTMVQLNR